MSQQSWFPWGCDNFSQSLLRFIHALAYVAERWRVVRILDDGGGCWLMRMTFPNSHVRLLSNDCVSAAKAIPMELTKSKSERQWSNMKRITGDSKSTRKRYRCQGLSFPNIGSIWRSQGIRADKHEPIRGIQDF